MVRAEVVFLGGGEIEDEVEEAAQSDELAEGRLQNTGRAEMLRAINAMSRAEAQLNDGRARRGAGVRAAGAGAASSARSIAGAISCARFPTDRASTRRGA